MARNDVAETQKAISSGRLSPRAILEEYARLGEDPPRGISSLSASELARDIVGTRKAHGQRGTSWFGRSRKNPYDQSVNTRIKNLESGLAKVVKTQRVMGAVVLEAVNRIDETRKRLGLPSGGRARGKAISSTRRTPSRAAAGAITAPGEWMRFEYTEGRSNKFWKVRLQGATLVTHWGPIGYTGQETVKRYGSPAEARNAGEKLIQLKLNKGYLLVHHF